MFFGEVWLIFPIYIWMHHGVVSTLSTLQVCLEFRAFGGCCLASVSENKPEEHAARHVVYSGMAGCLVSPPAVMAHPGPWLLLTWQSMSLNAPWDQLVPVWCSMWDPADAGFLSDLVPDTPYIYWTDGSRDSLFTYMSKSLAQVLLLMHHLGCV